jgi:UPF0755 protein
MIRVAAAVFAAMAIAALLAAMAAVAVIKAALAPGPAPDPVTILVERGSGLQSIGEALAAAGAVRDGTVFVLAVRFGGLDRVLQAGEYAFPPHVSAAAAARAMARGAVVVHRLTVPEGLTSREIRDLLVAEPLLSGPVEAAADGTLLPETYRFTRGDARQGLIDRMQRDMRDAVDALWPRRDADLPFDTPQEAVALAAIVEKETAVPGERPLVAGVFVNRLKRGMPLQSDPTVIYALTGGRGALGRTLARADWAIDSPYNTYRNTGLPPGAIANPGRESIAAVLHPAETDYLYFVADGSGGHAFAATLEEHNRNVEAWRRLRDGGTDPAGQEEGGTAP